MRRKKKTLLLLMMVDLTQDEGYLFVSEGILKAALLAYENKHKTPVFLDECVIETGLICI